MNTPKKQTGGFAFPVHGTPGLDPCGMTLRDYFAAQALPSIFAARSQAIRLATEDVGACPDFDFVAEESYAMADAMLRAEKS